MDRKKRIKEHTDSTCTVHKHEEIKTGNDNDRHSSVCTRSQTRAKNENTADLINSSCLVKENQKMTIGTSTSSKDFHIFLRSQDSEDHVDSGYDSDNSFQKSIGHRVGLGSFDLITELAGVEPNLVLDIIKQVGENIQDLASFCAVSPQWQTIVESISPESVTEVVRYRKEQQQIGGLAHKENYSKEKIIEKLRCVTESDSPLAIVQEIGKPCCTSTPKQTKDLAALHNKYYQAGQQLLVDESLTKCARFGCASPAKHLFNKQKGQCTNSNCSYEFCTNCRCEFHGGEPCKVFEKKFKKKKKGGIGSKRSKTNLNRLGRL